MQELFIYSKKSDIQINTNYINSSTCLTHNDCKIAMSINTFCVCAELCEHIEYQFEKYKTSIKSVRFNYKNTETHETIEICYIFKLLYFFQDIEKISIVVDKKISLDNNFFDVVKELLCYASTKNLYLDINILFSGELHHYITQNQNIKNVTVCACIDDLRILCHNQMKKINSVDLKILNNQKFSVESINNMFKLSPNLTNIKFISLYCNSENVSFDNDALELVINFITSSSFVEKIEFCCYLSDVDIQYICDNIINANIKKISFACGSKIHGSDALISMLNLIKNNRDIRIFNTGYTNLNSVLFEILKELENTNIQYFYCTFYYFDNEEISKMQEKILNCLLGNYCLIYIDITIIYMHTLTLINTDIITNRNKKLIYKNRFIKTKPVISDNQTI